MNTRQLNSIAREICTDFQGVYSRDMVPLKKQRLILNTSKSDHGGEHWQAIFDGLWFCSFGLPCPFRGLKNVVDKPIQSLFTSLCGEHCLYFIHQCQYNLPLVYTDDTSFNDKYVAKWFKKKFSNNNYFDFDYALCQSCTRYMPN